MSVLPEVFKEGLGRWATGVTVVTARSGDKVHGMTVSAFNEVSLDPPLVLVCAECNSHTLPLIREGGAFAVNILSRDQEALSNRFASKRDEWRRFEGLDWDTGPTGAPLLRGVVASLDCRLVADPEHGDHAVCIGQVEEIRYSDRAPLLHFRGRYGSLAE